MPQGIGEATVNQSAGCAAKLRCTLWVFLELIRHEQQHVDRGKLCLEGQAPPGHLETLCTMSFISQGICRLYCATCLHRAGRHI